MTIHTDPFHATAAHPAPLVNVFVCDVHVTPLSTDRAIPVEDTFKSPTAIHVVPFHATPYTVPAILFVSVLGVHVTASGDVTRAGTPPLVPATTH